MLDRNTEHNMRSTDNIRITDMKTTIRTYTFDAQGNQTKTTTITRGSNTGKGCMFFVVMIPVTFIAIIAVTCFSLNMLVTSMF